MARFSKKAKIIVFSLLATILILLITFFSYWAFVSSAIKDFATLEPSKMKLEGNFINLCGTNIYYIEKKASPAGEGLEGDARNIILVHGLGGGSFTFRKNMDAMSDAGFNVYAIDLKGFAYSERQVKSDYSHEKQAEILLEFMEKKQIKSVPHL